MCLVWCWRGLEVRYLIEQCGLYVLLMWGSAKDDCRYKNEKLVYFVWVVWAVGEILTCNPLLQLTVGICGHSWEQNYAHTWNEMHPCCLHFGDRFFSPMNDRLMFLFQCHNSFLQSAQINGRFTFWRSCSIISFGSISNGLLKKFQHVPRFYRVGIMFSTTSLMYGLPFLRQLIQKTANFGPKQGMLVGGRGLMTSNSYLNAWSMRDALMTQVNQTLAIHSMRTCILGGIQKQRLQASYMYIHSLTNDMDLLSIWICTSFSVQDTFVVMPG